MRELAERRHDDDPGHPRAALRPGGRRTGWCSSTAGGSSRQGPPLEVLQNPREERTKAYVTGYASHFEGGLEEAGRVMGIWRAQRVLSRDQVLDLLHGLVDVPLDLLLELHAPPAGVGDDHVGADADGGEQRRAASRVRSTRRAPPGRRRAAAGAAARAGRAGGLCAAAASAIGSIRRRRAGAACVRASGVVTDVRSSIARGVGVVERARGGGRLGRDAAHRGRRAPAPSRRRRRSGPRASRSSARATTSESGRGIAGSSSCSGVGGRRVLLAREGGQRRRPRTGSRPASSW